MKIIKTMYSTIIMNCRYSITKGQRILQLKLLKSTTENVHCSVSARTISLLKTNSIINKNLLSKGTKRSLYVAMHNSIHTSSYNYKQLAVKKETSALALKDFQAIKNKKKETFLETVRMYEKQHGGRRGHVEFIYTALKYMEDFGVHKDLESYKRLLDVFPKGKFIPQNLFQAEFLHYPKQQHCAVDLLEQMEDNAVIPDEEMETMLYNIFGKNALPLRKMWRMAYWMPKFKNLNPWPAPRPLPNDPSEIAMAAIKKMSGVDVQSKISIYRTEDVADSIDKTWIVSAISPTQQELLERHPQDKAIFIEGPFKVWVGAATVDYFILRADLIERPKAPEIDEDDVTNIKLPFWENSSTDLILAPTVHEQEDAIIFAMCATGTSTKDSLLSWIRCLEEDNPIISKFAVVFSFISRVEKEEVKEIEDGISRTDASSQKEINDR